MKHHSCHSYCPNNPWHPLGRDGRHNDGREGRDGRRDERGGEWGVDAMEKIIDGTLFEWYNLGDLATFYEKNTVQNTMQWPYYGLITMEMVTKASLFRYVQPY